MIGDSVSTLGGLLGLLLASTVFSSPAPIFRKRDCTGQSIFHSDKPGEAATNKQNWVNMGFTATDLAIIMKEDAGRPTVESDENGAPGNFAFTIFNMNWWMVKKSCPEYTPPGYGPDTNEDQIPPEIFQTLNNDQSQTLTCLHQSMNDPFFNRAGDPPTSNDSPSPAWWAAQRGGPGAALAYLAGAPLDPVVSDYMWNTLGIENWIVQGGHMTDDWIESSCLSGLTAPAECPVLYPDCGAPDL